MKVTSQKLEVTSLTMQHATCNMQQTGRYISFVICALCFVIVVMGCARLKETAKGIAGVSTQVLEDGRKEAISETFNYDYNTCYAKAREILIERSSYIYAADKNMLAIYISETDTTPVGLFFKEISPVRTQIEVSSPSAEAKELISRRVFSILKGKEETKEKK